MSAAWVAGHVRARAIAGRAVGLPTARLVATSPSLPAALDELGHTPYAREVAKDATLASAQHGVAAAVLWHLRVLAGWLPTDGVRALRALAGWFEIANVDQHLRALAGRPVEPPFRLGMLATAWPRLAGTGSPAQVRAVLAASEWRDPGGDSPRDIQLGMRLAWAERVQSRARPATRWVRGAVALLLARERFAVGQPLPPASRDRAVRLLGPGCLTGDSVPELAGRLPRTAGDALADVRDGTGLWVAEARWWARLRESGRTSVTGFGLQPVLGAVGVLAADAWLVRAALELAARGGGPAAAEAFDALA